MCFVQGNDVVPEGQVDAGLEAMQPALLHQVVAELAEAESGLVVAEAAARGCTPSQT